MIVAVWGIVNGEHVDFYPVKGREGYWEGYATPKHEYQDIEIWAKKSNGAIGHLECSILVRWTGEVRAQLLLAPYKARLIKEGDCYD